MKLTKNEENNVKTQKSSNLIAAAILVGIGLLGIVAFGIFRDFDAQEYVNAILQLTFKGKAETTAQLTEGTTEEELLAQYEDGIESFVRGYIIGDAKMNEEERARYISLCKEIFNAAKFEVKEAEEISKKEYKVPVEYYATNVFAEFSESVKLEMQRLVEKVNQGGYTGTEEEIQEQMQTEFLENVYQILEKAYQEAECAEKETMMFTVKKGASDLYTVDEAQVHRFVIKIMGIDVIQD